MKKNMGIARVKVIVLFFVVFIIIYSMIIINKDEEKKDTNIIKEENRVVYREEGLPIVNVDTDNIVVVKPKEEKDININEIDTSNMELDENMISTMMNNTSN